jgi:hypothetical protein
MNERILSDKRICSKLGIESGLGNKKKITAYQLES